MSELNLEALLACSLCPKLCASRTQVVPAKGPLDARVMIVAQAPGRNEDQAGVPLIGKSGHQLDALLAIAGLDPAQIYMTNAAKCWPGDGDRRPSKRELSNCAPWLLTEIALVRPTFIVTLGDVALQAVMSGQRLSQVHGQAIAHEIELLDTDSRDYWSGRVFATYHPSATNYNANLKPVIIEDFKKLKEVLSGKPRTANGWRFGSLAEVLERGNGPIAIDYETTQPKVDGRFAPPLAQPIGIAVARRVGRAVVASYEPPTALHSTALAQVLADEAIEKVAHNTKFERTVSLNAGIDLRACHDTKVMAHLLGFVSTHLKDLSGSVLGVRQQRFEEWDGIDPRYPCGDAAFTLMLYEVLRERLIENDLWRVYLDIELPLIPVLADMERAGIEFSEERRVALRERIVARAAEIEAQYEGVNLASPKQVSELLFGEAGHSTAKAALEAVPEAATIVEWRELAKLLGSYIDKFPRLRYPTDGRIHGSFNQAGGHDDDDKGKESPSNFRLSSSNPNLQNIPSRTALGQQVNECIVPAEGYIFVKADAGQEEPRIASVITGDQTLRERLERGDDIYLPLAQLAYDLVLPRSLTAKRLAGSYLELGKVVMDGPRTLTRHDHEWRQIGKKFFLATLYGAQWRKLQETALKDLGLALTNVEAQRLSALLKAEYPDIVRLGNMAWDEVQATGYASTIFGHKRWLYGAFSDRRSDRAQAIREGANFKVSGPGAAIMKVALRKTWGAISELDARIVLSIHDSIVVECSPPLYHYVAEVLTAAFQGMLEIALPVDIEIITREGFHMSPSEYAFISHACPHCRSDLLWSNLLRWYRCTGCSRKYRVTKYELLEVKGE